MNIVAQKTLMCWAVPRLQWLRKEPPLATQHTGCPKCAPSIAARVTAVRHAVVCMQKHYIYVSTPHDSSASRKLAGNCHTEHGLQEAPTYIPATKTTTSSSAYSRSFRTAQRLNATFPITAIPLRARAATRPIVRTSAKPLERFSHTSGKI